MDEKLVSKDNWECDGLVVTPEMRRDCLEIVADMHVRWDCGGFSYRWDRAERRLVQGDPKSVVTVGDLFGEIADARHPHFSFDFYYYSDEFDDWVTEYLEAMWGDASRASDDDDTEPIYRATSRLFDWLDTLVVEDVLAWRDAERPVDLSELEALFEQDCELEKAAGRATRSVHDE